MHLLNTRIGNMEEKLDRMSKTSSGKEHLEKEDEIKKDLDKEDQIKEDLDLDKEDEIKKDVPKSQIWSDYPRSQRRHTITNGSISKSKSVRKN